MEKRKSVATDGKESAEDIFFVPITSKERREVAKWIEKQKEEKRSEEYMKIMREALQSVQYDYWIVTLEPSIKDGKIYYQEGLKVATGIIAGEWKELCKEYNQKRGSRIATLYELFIWYTLRVAKGYWTYEELMQDSDKLGNYSGSNVRYSKKDLRHYKRGQELTGARECGGYKDGQGNTCKIVTHKGKFLAVGGCYKVSGRKYPIGCISSYYGAFKLHTMCHGVTVLTKP